MAGFFFVRLLLPFCALSLVNHDSRKSLHISKYENGLGGSMWRSTILIIIIVTFAVTSGCSVYMAAEQPDKKNLDLFKVGTPRSLLLSEFGLPVVSEVSDNGERVEVYTFTQGYSAGTKAGRAVFHGAADVLTLGLWEVIATPTESMLNGDEMAYEVRYDQNDLISQVVGLKLD